MHPTAVSSKNEKMYFRKWQRLRSSTNGSNNGLYFVPQLILIMKRYTRERYFLKIL